MSTILGILIAFAAIVVTWRLASRRRHLPCPVWLRWLVELDNPFTQISRAAVIADHLDLETGMTVADVGCGPGRVTVPTAQRVAPAGKVVALDIQPGMLTRAKEKAQAAGLTNIEFLPAAIGDGKLGCERFDRALLVTVLGEVPDRLAALQEIYAALKPGGMLYIGHSERIATEQLPLDLVAQTTYRQKGHST